MRLYSLRKSKSILLNSFKRLNKRGHKLSCDVKEHLLDELKQLDQYILRKQKQEANTLARKVEKQIETLLPKTIFDHVKEFGAALIFALVVASLIRTMWFELYEIPTGSMRPTFQENDRLIASKTTYGVNIPFLPKHFLFEPKLIQNGDIVIFTVENMDVYDPDTLYFYLFKGKRLLIKRLIGKPGDTLYFYGGQIYGIDKDGHDLKMLREGSWMNPIHHVPYITFDGREKVGDKLTDYYFYQSGISSGKIQLSSIGTLKGYVYNGSQYIPDRPEALLTPHNEIATFSDLWGIKNYAMARILSKDEVSKYSSVSLQGTNEGILYLELFHTPSFTYPYPQFIKDYHGSTRAILTPQVTLIPLHQKHLTRIMDHLYTARFVVKNGYARRFSTGEGEKASTNEVPLPGVEDGTYEFFDGKAFAIGFGGIRHELPKENSIYGRNLKMIQTLFNLGIDFNLIFAPRSKDRYILPQRFAYFKEGSLFIMGAKVFDKDDPTLTDFVNEETKKQQASNAKKPYIPFKDYGPPLLADGSIDQDFIRTFGLKVPEKMYFVLGDNYAMSADSRDFGFVPEDNLRGSPAIILWPPQDRFGLPKQPEHPLITLPNAIIWALLAMIGAGVYLYEQKKINTPLFK